jgi:hypothetical protein
MTAQQNLNIEHLYNAVQNTGFRNRHSSSRHTVASLPTLDAKRAFSPRVQLHHFEHSDRNVPLMRIFLVSTKGKQFPKC